MICLPRYFIPRIFSVIEVMGTSIFGGYWVLPKKSKSILKLSPVITEVPQQLEHFGRRSLLSSQGLVKITVNASISRGWKGVKSKWGHNLQWCIFSPSLFGCTAQHGICSPAMGWYLSCALKHRAPTADHSGGPHQTIFLNFLWVGEFGDCYTVDPWG